MVESFLILNPLFSKSVASSDGFSIPHGIAFTLSAL
jgi:hypothetical protein